jgi:hypothetical protein
MINHNVTYNILDLDGNPKNYTKDEVIIIGNEFILLNLIVWIYSVMAIAINYSCTKKLSCRIINADGTNNVVEWYEHVGYFIAFVSSVLMSAGNCSGLVIYYQLGIPGKLFYLFIIILTQGPLWAVHWRTFALRHVASIFCGDVCTCKVWKTCCYSTNPHALGIRAVRHIKRNSPKEFIPPTMRRLNNLLNKRYNYIHYL